jgi:sarcosine oxidase
VSTYDVIVVGLGAMGSSALYQLSRRGLRVLGLEAYAPGHQLGSSHGESRIIRLAYHEHPSYVPLLRRAYELWSALESESGEDVLNITGGLMIGPPDSEVVGGARASAELHGLEHEMLSADEMRRRYPVFRATEGDVALYEPRSGFLRPERCLAAFTRLAIAHGAEARYAEPVRAWRSETSNVVLSTDQGEYATERVVFACGARHTQVLGQSTPPVTPERSPLFWFQPQQPDLFEVGRMPIYLWETADAVTFYGFPHVEWQGVKVAVHHAGEPCDPDTVDRGPRPADEARLRALIRDRMPELNGPLASTLVCLYENSPDSHFLIDRLPEQPNVIYAGGFSGHGFKFASVVGEILADLVTRGEATPHADFLRASRFEKESVA